MRHRSKNKESLKDFAASLGYQIANDPMNADIYISVDYNTENEEILHERKSARKFNVLFRNEPSCVLPSGYSKSALNLNDFTLTFGRAPDNPQHEYWPQFWQVNSVPQVSTQRIENRAALINANKLNLSSQEMYSLRRLCVKKLNNVDLFGDDWNSSLNSRIKVAAIEILKKPSRNLFTFLFHARYWFNQWPVTLAPVEKSDVLNQYKVSLVIENEATYLSEKIFDALASGCIPVYVGPDLRNFGFPENIVFQAEPSLDSVNEQLNLAFKSDFQKNQREINRWLNSIETRERHLGEIVMERALRKCVEHYFRSLKSDKN
jgi:hypothetical protein